MTARHFCFGLLVVICVNCNAPAAHALLQQVAREQDIVNLRLGQRYLVDDGTCPAGQVKEVSGAKMLATGVLAAKKCVPRLAPKTK
jgi:hypothetical protein